LKVEIPSSVLRPGANVLAIENRISPLLVMEYKGRAQTIQNYGKMPHIGITDISLRGDPDGSVLSADRRPPGVQAWPHDIHQWTLTEDFLEPGVPQARIVRMGAPRNGTCSGQIVIGAAQDAPTPSATLSDLVGPNGAKIPAAAVQVRWAQPLSIKQVKKMHNVAFFTYMPDRWLIRYCGAPSDTWVAVWSDHDGKYGIINSLWEKNTLQVFDRLSPKAPATVSAGSSQPVWITVEIPKETPAGQYTGTLAVKAGGLEPVNFEVRLQVFDYVLANTKDFTAYAGVDESPWALAAWAGVKPWSEEHWKLLEQSIQMAGKLSARVVGIPVIHNIEMNNGADAMIKWVKKGDGYDFDFTLADRYLDLWKQYGHSKSDIIIYIVLPANEYGKGGGTGSVTLIDPVTKKETAFLPPKAETPEGLKLWTECAKAIQAHFKARGFQDSNMHWGLFYDYIGPNGYALAEQLAKETPGIGWARSSHEGRKIHGGEALAGGGASARVTWNAAVRAEQKPPFGKDGTTASLKGWKNPEARLLLPRADSDVSALSVLPPLWQLREVQEMPTTSLHRGFGRISVDGWGRGAYFGPFNPWLIYPTPEGKMEGSIQFEVLREGLQENEARISIEKNDTLPPDIQKMLNTRTERIWMIPPRPEAQRISEYWAGWQEMSWDLYAAAALTSGGKAPSASERAKFFTNTPGVK
jgi:hypothetical protein